MRAGKHCSGFVLGSSSRRGHCIHSQSSLHTQPPQFKPPRPCRLRHNVFGSEGLIKLSHTITDARVDCLKCLDTQFNKGPDKQAVTTYLLLT